MTASDDQWKQALQLWQQLQPIEHEQLTQRLAQLDLDPAVADKVLKLAGKMHDQDQRLAVNSQALFAQAAQSSSQQRLIGKSIGVYQIIGLIAQGGMSTIYKAINTTAKINKPVALKLLSPYVFSDKTVELFKREQLILSQLQHPNIISFHHSGTTEDGTHYLIMEYVEGAKTIQDYCLEQKMTPKQIAEVVIKLARILAYAHRNLVIHRDIKPSNVLVDQHGNIKVIDFGIAQIAANDQATSTQVFTKDSASPEQILGQPVNIQTDVFSLGAILLGLLVQAKPLPEVNLATYDPQDDVRHVNRLLKQSDLDKDLKNIIRKAMHIDVSQRYPTMENLAQDLTHWLHKRPISATADSPWYQLKMFIARNPFTVSFGAVVMLALMVGLMVVNGYATQAQAEARKANETLDLITQVFSQSDSWNPPDPEKSMRQSLDEFSEDRLPELHLDDEVLAHVHATLGQIYGNFGLFERSLKHYQTAAEPYMAGRLPMAVNGLKIQSDMAYIMRIRGQSEAAIEVLQQVNQALLKHFPGEQQLRMGVMINWLDALYPSGYDSDTANQLEQDMRSLIAPLTETEPLTVANAYSAMSIKNQHQTNQDLSLAGQYLQQAMQLLDHPDYHESHEFISISRQLAILKFRHDQLQESSEIFQTLMTKLEPAKHRILIYSNLLDDHAAVLFKLERFPEALASLTQAMVHAKELKAEALVFSPLSKRAMYHVRLNDLAAGIKDQLTLLPVTAEHRPDLMHSMLFNLSMMLYPTQHIDLARPIMHQAIELIDPTAPGMDRRLLYVHLQAGLAEWVSGHPAQAELHWQLTQEMTVDQYQAERALLKAWVTGQLESTAVAGAVESDAETMVQQLLQGMAADVANQASEAVKHCEMPEDFMRHWNVALKQHFLSQCLAQLHAAGQAPSAAFTNNHETLTMGLQAANGIPTTEIQAHWRHLQKPVPAH